MARGAGRTYVNPKRSVFSDLIPLLIREHHLKRAKQVLAVNQNAGKFTKDDYDTFVGPGPASLAPPPPVTADRPPPNTRRRDLNMLDARFLPFPGRIWFTSGNIIDLSNALLAFLRSFVKTAPRAKDPSKKNHPFIYARSLEIYINGVKMDAGSAVKYLKDKDNTQVVLDIVNIAPHASTVEREQPTMFDIANLVAKVYGPGIQLLTGFVNSDRFGYAYGPGTGGPMSGGQVYALPFVRFALSAQGMGSGASNTRLRRVRQ